MGSFSPQFKKITISEFYDEKGADVASNKEPSFFLVRGRLPRSGWNIVEIGINFSDSKEGIHFYFDKGSGYSDAPDFFIPIKNGGISKRLCYVPKGLKGVKFQPAFDDGSVDIKHFRFSWMLPPMARRRISQRITNMHYRYRHLMLSELKSTLINESSRWAWRQLAWKRYNETFIKRVVHRSYRDWLEDNNHDTTECLSVSLEYQPLISILLPIYNTPIKYLRECIESVLSQSYCNWQLCIADDASTDPSVHALIQGYEEKDSRISVTFRKKNGHISAATNSALSLADGDFVAFLDHDDCLSSQALTYFVSAINTNRSANFFYCDEDKIDQEGQRFDPHFKPDWNPELLLSQNYICHFTLIKTSIVKSVGGFREGLEGAQDHDLFLRITYLLDYSQIVHIPRILYHWRAVDGSTAISPNEKKYTTKAGIRAVENWHYNNRSLAKVVAGLVPNTYRSEWRLPSSLPLVSILIPTRDGHDILRRCVDSILSLTSYSNYELIILNNQSRCIETLALFRKWEVDSRIKIYNWDKPFNYSAINNFGVKLASGSIIALLNDDVEVINDEWLSEMVSHACRNEIGCVGAKLYYPNETIQHAGVILGIGGVAGHSHKYFSRHDNGYFSRLKLVQNLSAVTGACLVVRKEIFNEVGGLNETDLAVAFNDVDFCLKVLAAGYRNLWTPYAELYHHESVSRGEDNTLMKRHRALKEAHYMRVTWFKELEADPAYNKQLTLIHEDFSLC
tara:strand:+ start:10182 stop:12392 length:2211 start_codon:yes stop_codon:yes gene_type:complete